MLKKGLATRRLSVLPSLNLKYPPVLTQNESTSSATGLPHRLTLCCHPYFVNSIKQSEGLLALQIKYFYFLISFYVIIGFKPHNKPQIPKPPPTNAPPNGPKSLQRNCWLPQITIIRSFCTVIANISLHLYSLTHTLNTTNNKATHPHIKITQI